MKQPKPVKMLKFFDRKRLRTIYFIEFDNGFYLAKICVLKTSMDVNVIKSYWTLESLEVVAVMTKYIKSVKLGEMALLAKVKTSSM